MLLRFKCNVFGLHGFREKNYWIHSRGNFYHFSGKDRGEKHFVMKICTWNRCPRSKLRMLMENISNWLLYLGAASLFKTAARSRVINNIMYPFHFLFCNNISFLTFVFPENSVPCTVALKWNMSFYLVSDVLVSCEFILFFSKVSKFTIIPCHVK